MNVLRSFTARRALAAGAGAIAVGAAALVGLSGHGAQAPVMTTEPARIVVRTQTPYPTHTPLPTYSPLPTYTLAPTYTPFPVPVRAPVRKLTPTRTPPPSPLDTPTPKPTATVSACKLDASFQADVTIPDNTRIEIGQPFVKTWRIANVGSCEWRGGYQLTHVSGDSMGAPPSVAVDSVARNESVEISVSLRAPNAPGTHSGVWQMVSDKGKLFGGRVIVQIVAFDPSSPPTAIATTVAIAPTSPPAAVCSCAGNIYNCDDFSTHGQAYACFRYCISQGRGDIHRLDGDNDGDPCEALH